MARDGGASAKQLGLADLARSGLDEAAAKKMRVTFLTPEQTYYRAHVAVPSYELPYPELNGARAKFSRLRFLTEVIAFGGKKAVRYWQPKDSPARAYFPPFFDDWPRRLSDPGEDLWLTEGEKKAAAACRAGVACVGLGGVWSWKSNRAKQLLIDDLAAIKWEGRRVVLAFDADAEPKPDVAAALYALASELHRRGARLELAVLPLLAGTLKTGLDDYLVAGHELATLALESFGTGAKVAALNAELAVVRKPAGVYHLETGQLFGVRGQLEALYANRRVERLTAKGTVTLVPVLDEWLKWPLRREYLGLAYAPGAARITARNELNLWSGWPVEPVAGDVTLWHDLLDHLFGREEEGQRARTWFERWAAYPLQHPGAKLYTYVLLHSREHGTGKSLVLFNLARLYGANAATITQKHLHSDFNEWMHNKQFIVGEEVTGSDKKTDADVLKYLVTGDTVRINAKFQPSYELRNCVNCGFSSNQPDALSLEDDDRRAFIWEVRAGRVPVELAQAYDPWYKSTAGQAALFHYLLSLDLGGFDPLAPALVTAAKRRMVALSGSDADRLVRELLETPERFLVGEGEALRELYQLDELITRLELRGYAVPRRIELVRALRRHGALDLDPTKTPAGSTTRPWALRDVERWRAAGHAARAAALSGAANPVKVKRF